MKVAISTAVCSGAEGLESRSHFFGYQCIDQVLERTWIHLRQVIYNRHLRLLVSEGVIETPSSDILG
jgi:hypothetical protein